MIEKIESGDRLKGNDCLLSWVQQSVDNKSNMHRMSTQFQVFHSGYKNMFL